MRKPALLSQVLTVNTLLIVATVFAASVAARLDLGDAADLRQFGVLAVAILATVLANNFVLRRRFAPLQSLTATMERVDLATPGTRARAWDAEPADVARLREAFNRMLERVEAERSAAASSVLRAQEAERARIARDLHDEVNQALTAITLRLRASAQDAPPALAGELAETQRLAGQAMRELLGLAHELRPATLDDHGLVAALRTQVREFGARAGVEVAFRAAEPLPELSVDEQLVVYRVVQESLSNVTQHAGAVHVSVTLSGGDGVRLHVVIADDGRGFDPARAGGGDGLAGMRERARLAGGRLHIRSLPGTGTTVELSLTSDDEAAGA